MTDPPEGMVGLSDGAQLWMAIGGRTGDDAPGLVLLHGGAGMWDYLEPVAGLAAGSFRTHRYDQRGCGRSSPSDEYGLARYTADLDELRRHLGYREWYLFGHSFGATLALEYAAAYGSRVAGLVYCSGLGLGWSTHRATYRARQRARLTDAERRRLADLERRTRTWAEEVEWRTLSWLPDFVHPELAREWAAEDARTPLPLNLACNRAFSAETRAWSDEQERARWSGVSCPVWIVHGDGDPRPADGPRALASVLPDARFRTVPGAGHQPWRERPDAVARVLAEVAELAGSADRVVGGGVLGGAHPDAVHQQP